MLPADEIQQVRDGLWSWQRYQPAVKVECSSCAVRVGRRLVFIDPIPLTAEALGELLQHGEPAAILATNGNHARAAAAWRTQLGIPLLAHPDAAPGLDCAVDRELADGECLEGSLTVIALPGGAPGEIALHDSRGWMIVGDALIHLGADGLAVLPEKYCDDFKTLRHSLRKLLRFDFEVLTFAHGLPLASRARPRLEALLA